ncbi:MAG: RDD family protein [Cyclobacteriaceae bacterium]
MTVVQVQTAQNVNINYAVASLGDRILAYLIDGLIMGAYIIILIFIAFSFQADGGDVARLGIIAILSLPTFFYHLISEIFMDGQSLGKRQLNIKVIKLDGAQPGIGAYLLRWLLRPIDFFFYGGIAILCIAIGGKGQRLGDILAGTSVIKMNPVVGDVKSPLKTIRQEEDYDVTFPDAINLSDKDVAIVKEALKVFRETGNKEPVVAISDKSKELLKISTSMPDVKFLNVLINDFNYLTSR